MCPCRNKKNINSFLMENMTLLELCQNNELSSNCSIKQFGSLKKAYPIQPNYRTVHLGFSKLLENTSGKICICLLKGTLKKDQQRTY